MIQIIVNNETLDLYDDVSINFVKEFQNSEDLEVKPIEYSYEIEIPTTLKNRRIFGFQNELNVTRKFTEVYSASLVVNETTIFDGNLIINEMSQDKFKGNLYTPEVKTIKDILGDVQLSAITPHYIEVTDYNNISETNMQVSRAMSNPNAEVPHICFPYCVYGLPNTRPYEGNTLQINDKHFQDLYYKGTTYSLDNIFPAFNVCSVLKDIFHTFGYKLEGNIFSNNKFKLLYQSYAESPETYAENVMIPYYAKMKLFYQMGKKDKTSATATEHQEKDKADKPLLYASDQLISSDMTRIEVISDEYEMINNGYVFAPRSGWYEIRVNGELSLPTKEAGWDHSERIRIRGYVSGKDKGKDTTTFQFSSYEFHINKGRSDSPKYLGRYYTMPIVPNEFVGGLIENNGRKYYIKESAFKNYKEYNNNSTVPVKNYSGFDTSSFIIGCQFGCSKSIPYEKKKPGCHLNYRNNKIQCTMNLRRKNTTPTYGTFDEGKYVLIQGSIFDTASSNSNPITDNQAVALANENSYANLVNGVDNRVYDGQQTSTIRQESITRGTFNLCTCVWLEKGEYLTSEVITSYVSGSQECGCLEACECGKNRKDYGGYTNVAVKYELTMGLVSSDKDYSPTSEHPIIVTDSDLQRKFPTNFNKFLGSMKCNDFVNGFLTTFNCRLSRKNKTTYSIDYNTSNEFQTNVVDIDNYVNKERINQKRITLPSEIQLKWKIDNKELGYALDRAQRPYILNSVQEYGVWSNDRDSMNVSGFCGEKIFENKSNTNGSVSKKESIWSYTYMDFFKCVNTHNNETYYIKAPIITTQNDWDNNTFHTNMKPTTKMNPRLFYPQSNVVTNTNTINSRLNNNLLTIRGTKGDGWITSRNENDALIKLLLVDNTLMTKGILGDEGGYVLPTFMLDYDNSQTNSINNEHESDKTITDVFYGNIKIYNKYNVEVKCILPTELYKLITPSTLVSLDGSLYSIEKIDGFDASEEKECTLTLVSI